MCVEYRRDVYIYWSPIFYVQCAGYMQQYPVSIFKSISPPIGHVRSCPINPRNGLTFFSVHHAGVIICPAYRLCPKQYLCMYEHTKMGVIDVFGCVTSDLIASFVRGLMLIHWDLNAQLEVA